MSSFLWLITTVYSIGYMRKHQEKNQTRFYLFFAITMATVMGIAFAANLFTLYIFYELLTLSTYPLVVHAGDQKAKQGGRTYLAILFFTSILFFLLAVINTWLVSGTLDFSPGGVFNQQIHDSMAVAVLLPLFILGIGKAAIFPFHRWLPAAMVAPTPVSALLHAVAVVKGGVFTILKVCVYIFGIDVLQNLPTTQALLYLAGISVFIASLVAMRQDNLKKRLAYSTISQLGYVTIGALLANKAGIIGGAMHMAIHSFGKITLFFCAGAVLVMTHKTKISEMHGLGRQMPITMVAFFIASLSIIGLPPTAGMWSKWFLLQGTIEAGQWLLLIILGLSSLMNIFYLLVIPLRAFFCDDGQTVVHPGPSERGTLEAPLPILAAIVVCTAVCLILFLFPQPLYELAATIVSAPDS
jgi:multicomponent Na+:H+ antiporter subunit D